MKEQIEKRLAELTAERAARAQEAQRVDFGYAAAIGELQKLLEQIEAPKVLHDEEQDHAAVA